MISRNKKEQIVKLVLSEIVNKPDNPWKDIPCDKVLFLWFHTGRQGDGLRLTDEGHKAFTYAELEHYDFPLVLDDMRPNSLSFANFTLHLSRKIKCPFYVGINRESRRKSDPFIRIYDHKIAMLITLYGTVGDYVDSVIS